MKRFCSLICTWRLPFGFVVEYGILKNILQYIVCVKIKIARRKDKNVFDHVYIQYILLMKQRVILKIA